MNVGKESRLLTSPNILLERSIPCPFVPYSSPVVNMGCPQVSMIPNLVRRHLSCRQRLLPIFVDQMTDTKDGVGQTDPIFRWKRIVPGA